MKHFLVSVFICGTSVVAYAQFTALGQNAPQGWKSISNEYVTITYPDPLYMRACRMAELAKMMILQHNQSIGKRHKKIPIILHAFSARSNGFVSVQPFRSEFYLEYAKNFLQQGTQGWDISLTVHEMRHVQQFNNMLSTWSHFLNIFTWDGGHIWNHIWYLPAFYEGDAVFIETALSQSGRGRLPLFMAPFYAQWNEREKPYSFQKANNGSFKHWIPNHYPLGFMAHYYIRSLYGKEGSKALLPAQREKSYEELSLSQRKEVRHIGDKGIYLRSYDSFQNLWRSHTESLAMTPTTQVLRKEAKSVQNYFSPRFVDNETLLVVKSDYKQTKAMYQVNIKTGEKQRILLWGQGNSHLIETGGGKVVWTQTSRHVRYPNSSYSNVYLYDIQSRQRQRLTSKGYYFMPSLSQDGEKIIAIHADRDGATELVQLTEDGHITLFRKEGATFSHPFWTHDSHSILFVMQRNNRVGIYTYHLQKRELNTLLPASPKAVGQLSLLGDSLLFVASAKGIDEVYCLSLSSLKIQQITTTPTGSYFPTVSPDKKQIVTTSPTLQGFRLRKSYWQPSDSFLSAEEFIVSPATFWSAKPFKQEKTIPDSFPVPQLTPLSSTLWERNYTAAYLLATTKKYAAKALLADYTGSYSAEIEGGYNYSNQLYYLQGKLSYARYFPVLSLSGTWYSARTFSIGERKDNGRTFQHPIGLKESILGINLALPFTFQQGKYYKSLRLTAIVDRHMLDYSYSDDVTTLLKANNYFQQEAFHSSKAVVQFSWLKPRAYLQLAPSLGIELTVAGTWGLDAPVSQTWGEGRLFLPGMFRTHSLQITGSQYHTGYLKDYAFVYPLTSPEGSSVSVINAYDQREGTRYAKAIGLRANYSFPLIYPDIALLRYLYIKRIWAEGFFSSVRVTSPSSGSLIGDYMATGGRFFVDIEWLGRGSYPIHLGIQYILYRLPRSSSGFPFSWVLRIPLSL